MQSKSEKDIPNEDQRDKRKEKNTGNNVGDTREIVKRAKIHIT